MNLSLRYKKSLLAISLAALPWLVAVVSSQAQDLGGQTQVVAQIDRQLEAYSLPSVKLGREQKGKNGSTRKTEK